MNKLPIMQEVVCFHCGRIVHISPDAELCSVCGENLRELIHPAYASSYFYDRAAHFAAGPDLLQAVREVDRGLNYEPSSELRLLGAILSQRIGDVEQMRRHVAAIPVDDILRPEAEWLLRSHQVRQREARMAGRQIVQRPPLSDEILPFEEEHALPVPVASATYRRAAVQHTSKRQTERAIIGMAAALLVVAVLATGLAMGRDHWSIILPWSATAEGISDTTEDPSIVAPVYQQGQEPAPSGPILAPTPTPAVGVPEDVVEIIDPEPVAQGTLTTLGVNPLQPFDLNAYLMESARPDLVDLGVAASSQDGTILLDGIVPSYLARRDLIAMMEAAPGVTRVSGANLLVRLPPTYTVAEGDTLWAISYEFYGGDRIAEILAANRTILPSANQLTIGMELTLPEIEQP